ncbi:Ribokinase-like protein [Chytriomyces cf. hyalinus JEL632]|nr:Ribokinase-like protein [Chytriomyces cf. hyalinus JEL632]
MEAPRVLSVQSHVVHGHVGNKSATFPLQLLGFNVDPLNTVQFSNHTGYAKFTGERLEGPQIDTLVEGLEANGILNRYTHLLTGYLGRPSILTSLQALVKKLKSINKNLVFMMDPVLGDDGKLYVAPELVDLYRDNLIQYADIITPNGFEATLLSGVKIVDEASALEAIQKLHSMGPETVVVTSVDFGTKADLTLYASHSPSNTRFKISFPKLKGSFTGTGDLFAACLLARLSLGPGGVGVLKLETGGSRVVAACETVVSSMNQVLNETMQRMKARGEDAGAAEGRGAENMRYRELCLIESRGFIENPDSLFKAMML